MEGVTKLTLPATRKLKRTEDFKRAYDAKCSSADGRMIVYAVTNNGLPSRIGVSVSKKVGGAVVRNRVKRMFREAFRLIQHEIPSGFDYVLIPRGPALEPTIDDWKLSLGRLTQAAAKKAMRPS